MAFNPLRRSFSQALFRASKTPKNLRLGGPRVGPSFLPPVSACQKRYSSSGPQEITVRDALNTALAEEFVVNSTPRSST